jgi:NAD(P)-dependent dehydrogenase (short-subunit alcohol dehydrogenase family)
MQPVLLVTGGSQGIGAATARLGAARGYRVALSFKSRQDLAERVVDEIRAGGGEAQAVRADVAQEAAIVGLFETVEGAFGRISAVVNNGGVTGPVATLARVTTAILDEVLQVNVRGAFLVLREAARRLQEGGAVVNVSSRASELGGPNEWIHYAASKGAVDTLTIGAAKELAPRGIRVNAVTPGLIETEIHAKAGMPDRVERMKSGIPLGRAGTAEEVAKVILWLLSDEASYVTGAIVPVSGGR